MRLSGLAVLAVFLLLTGCTSRYLTNPFASIYSSKNPDAGSLDVYFTDAPLKGLAQLNVTVGEVEILKGSSWKLLQRVQHTYDFVALANKTALLGSFELDPGAYSKLRFKVKGASAAFLSVPPECLKIGAAASIDCAPTLQVVKAGVPWTKTEIEYDFEVQPRQNTTVLLDLDLASLKYSGGKYSLVPHITPLSEDLFKARFYNLFCGDGYCQRVTCTGEGCPPLETHANCPQDCPS